MKGLGLSGVRGSGVLGFRQFRARVQGTVLRPWSEIRGSAGETMNPPPPATRQPEAVGIVLSPPQE